MLYWQVYKELENNAHQAYWEDVQTIVLDELSKLRRRAAPAVRRDTVHQAVADDVTMVSAAAYWDYPRAGHSVGRAQQAFVA